MGVSKMSGTRIARHAATIGLGAALAAIAACAEVEVAPTESLAESQAAEQVAALTELRERYDDDGDGFVSRVEAEGYWRRHFGRLDDNDDGRLSRTELEPEAPGAPDLEPAYEELVGATEQDYVGSNLGEFDRRIDPTVGMMSTADFHEVIGIPDPALSEPGPELVP
jgi:hypothetical protein